MKIGVLGTDLGDLPAARGMEAYVLFWLQLYMSQKTPEFNIQVVRRPS